MNMVKTKSNIQANATWDLWILHLKLQTFIQICILDLQRIYLRALE